MPNGLPRLEIHTDVSWDRHKYRRHDRVCQRSGLSLQSFYDPPMTMRRRSEVPLRPLVLWFGLLIAVSLTVVKAMVARL